METFMLVYRMTKRVYLFVLLQQQQSCWNTQKHLGGNVNVGKMWV